MIIDEKKYIEYVKKNKNITKCTKEILIELLNDDKIYESKNSNKQIKTFVDNLYLTNNLMIIAKFKLLINHFFNNTYSEKIIDYVKKNKNINDNEIIEYILKTPSSVKNITEQKNRLYKCNIWVYMIETICMNLMKTKIYKNTYGKNANNLMYLDIGCGSGKKTFLFGNEMKIAKNNINGTDILNWGPYSQNKIKHNFNFKEIKNGKINYDDNTFDIMTAFLMLHHVENLNELIDEMHRILKKNGILIIIEHDTHNSYDKYILDILHLFYAYFYDKNMNYIKSPDYAQYFNKIEWRFIFKKFRHIKTDYLYTEFTQNIRYDNLFYSIFVK
jgi:ubiquinone/menaquinone biosynthesis C-methylase UbiE